VVSVSGQTGAGIDALRVALGELARSVPPADVEARVRLWVDRSFTVRGSGTVVTGTLAAGTVRRGDAFELGDSTVSVRGLHRLGQPAEVVSAPARVALNVRSIAHDQVHRGDTLLTPGVWRRTRVIDVRSTCAKLPAHVVAHIGAAAVPATVRSLDASGTPGSALVRLTLDAPLPLQVGDRMLLRDPGLRAVLGGVTVLDPCPPSLRRRGAAKARAAALAADVGVPDVGAEVARRGAVSRTLLESIGVRVVTPLPNGVHAAGSWLVGESLWEVWRRRLLASVDRTSAELLDAGVSHADLIRAVHLDDAQLLHLLVESCPELEDAGGRVRRRGTAPALRADLGVAVSRLVDALTDSPFAAPEQRQLVALGLGRRELGAAAAARAILLLPGDIALLPDAPAVAADQLRGLPQPFTLSAARQALGTTRRVAVPLLEHLDRIGVTQRVDSDLRRVRTPASL
jgi:selenocysteine-specific elongation factor